MSSTWEVHEFSLPGIPTQESLHKTEKSVNDRRQAAQAQKLFALKSGAASTGSFVDDCNTPGQSIRC